MRRAWFLGLLGLLLLQTGCSPPPEVEVLQPIRGDLARSFTEQARTRLSQTFPVSMPVEGRLSRLSVEEGDRVRAGQLLATIDPVPLQTRVDSLSGRVQEYEARIQTQQDLSVEEAGTRQAQARLEAEEQTRQALAEQLHSARAAHLQARTEASRARRLFEQGFVPRQQMEQSRLAEISAGHALREAERRVQAQEALVQAATRQLEANSRIAERRMEERRALEGQLRSAQADLQGARHEAAQTRVLAPVDGVVLKRMETGPGHFPSGTRILEIGRMQDLEVLAEVLTQDAVALEPGTPVLLQAWDSGPPFRGVVRLLEPSGFTKPSSLGVEQQRVVVRIQPEAAPPRLGVGYRVQATFVTQTRQDVLLLPRSSLMQDPGGEWYVLVVEKDLLQRRPIRPGLQGDLQIEVLEGLREGETVVAIPDSTLQEGQKIRARAAKAPPSVSPDPG